MSVETILMKYMSKFSTLNEKQQRQIIGELSVQELQKGTNLLQQGDAMEECYFVLQGCVREYFVNEFGKEVTTNFYVEEDAIAYFSNLEEAIVSPYSLTCIEDCIILIGNNRNEQKMYDAYPELALLTRQMVEQNFGKVKEEFSTFMASTPEERYQSLMQKRPTLLMRVPQYQLASYLGISPETLSRIKKRVRDHQ